MHFIIFLIFITFLACGDKSPEGFNLPGQCKNRCEIAGNINELKDAVANASAGFSKCICLDSGEIQGDVVVGKSLYLAGKNDGSTHFKGVESGLFIGADDTIVKDLQIINGTHGITISKAKNVVLENINISGISTSSSVLHIEDSEVDIRNFSVSNISAGSLYGGRGIVVTGQSSNIKIRNSEVNELDATGIIIDGSHNIEIDNSSFSNCGFAGVWMQNMTEETGRLKISNSKLEDNAAVSLEILGSGNVELSDTKINGVEKREIAMEVVGDGIVMKSSALNNLKSSLSLNNIEISGFERAAVIIDGINGEKVKSVNISGLKIFDNSGIYGLIIQNAVEPDFLRSGITENPFDENDKNLEEPLYLIESIEML